MIDSITFNHAWKGRSMEAAEALIQVRVVKHFKSLRTPCPPAGTLGEIYSANGEFFGVRFPLPMTDMEGAVWETQGQDTDFMRLLFKADEIEPTT